MISNARGKHSSPGVYMEEIDKSYATRSLGVTTLGLVGETLKGPAFEPIRISDWSEFQDYFGGTSTKKFKGNGVPKYELPYIAKSYLQESKQLEVCRILGLSGYNAGPAWIIYGIDKNEEKHPIVVLRSKAEYGELTDDNICSGATQNSDKLTFKVDEMKIMPYNTIEGVLAGCKAETKEASGSLMVDKDNYGRFQIVVSLASESDSSDEKEFIYIPVSLNPGEDNYILNVLSMDAQGEDNYPIFVEELYDMAHIKAVEGKVYEEIMMTGPIEDIMSDYNQPFQEAITPWFVSEMKGVGKNVELKKLFRFHTISDGNAANSQVKVSIANILPDEGLFDVLIRDYNDTDASQLILERFSKCNMVPGTANYIGLQIGTYNGEYANKSKYVTVEVIENELTETCVPCGFLGFPLRKMEGFVTPSLVYNTQVYDSLKYNRQYFGMSDLSGVDLDVLMYKGVNAYHETQHPDYGYTNGFHLDAYLNTEWENEKGEKQSIDYTVDGISGYIFTTPDKDAGITMNGVTKYPHISSESIMKETIYSDKRLRKFTCYFYGGFDGWDIYRENRTNTDGYKANKYVGKAFTSKFNAGDYGLTGKVNSSDYYAYLAGYKQFDNPNKFKINLFATPGIDYVNNLGLFNDVLDIVEENRQGDCLYIVTTPESDDVQDAVSTLDSLDINTSYAATYYPWVKYYDSTNKKYISLPATKDVVRNFAYTDNVAQPWFASAGMSRGPVDCYKATQFLKQDEEDTLYEGMINPVKTFAADGVKIWGNKTMYQEDTPLNRINVRRLMIRVKDLVMSAATQLIFEQNDNTVEAQFRSIVEPILANVKQNRGISDFKVKTDTSAEARDRKELPAKIWIKPINCLEYIPISFVITPEGASFED